MAESFSMNGGDGPNSYTKNSKFQGKVLDDAKTLLSNSIQENLTIDSQSTLVFRIADMGCSVGPNTFTCIQTIIEAVKLKCKNGGQFPEFQVFFNDHVANDFNMLFKGLPADRTYTAAGVPGSFYGRLFPKASMNLMHTSFSLHWLSRIPKHLTKEGAPVWNKGRITCVSSSKEVAADYAAQFKADMTSFFAARAEELSEGGLLAILVPCRPESTLPSDSHVMYTMECLGHALVDMANEGMVDEHLVDTFNLPLYIPSPSEVKQVVLGMKNLSIESFQDLKYPPVDLHTPAGARAGAASVRAVSEVLVCNHFGSQLDREELFERYVQKTEDFAKTPLFVKTNNIQNLYMLVKRNAVIK